MHTIVAKWGNSLAIRLPKAVTERARLKAGDQLSFQEVEDSRLVLFPVREHLALADLVAAITEENRPDEVNWGDPAGREQW